MTAPAPAVTAPSDEPVAVGGRTFRIATSYTFEADLFVFSHLRASGVLRAFETMALSPDLDEARAQLVVTAYESGQLFALLGGILRETGVDWTPARAAENARFFAQLVDPAEKLLLLDVLAASVAGFFLGGAASRKTSLSFTRPRHVTDVDEPEMIGEAAPRDVDRATASTLASGTT